MRESEVRAWNAEFGNSGMVPMHRFSVVNMIHSNNYSIVRQAISLARLLHSPQIKINKVEYSRSIPAANIILL